jgi:hypothetical protein
MGFTEVPDGKGWVMCVAEDGRAMLKTVPIRNGAIDIPKLRGFLGDDLPDDGWIYIAVPAGKPVVVTSAISVQNRQEEQPPRVAEKPKKQEGPALGGVWVGEMKQGIYPAGYDFAMDLRQEGTRVTGTTRVAYRGSDPDNYGLMGVEGSFTGTTLTLKETSVIANHPPAGHSWCIKVLSLGWAPGSPPSLSGSWNAPDGCGTIFVTRAVLPGEE